MEVQREAQQNPGAASAFFERGLAQAHLLGRLRDSFTEWNRANGVIPFGARPYAPALVWLVAMGLAAALAPVSPVAATCITAAGVIVAIAGLRGSLLSRALTALAMAPGAVAEAPGWAWVLSGGVVALLVSVREGPIVLRSHDLQRHLDWCRRREESAHVLVVRFSLREVPKPVGILDSFRTTDSIALQCSHGVCELQAVLDDAGLSRDGVERRILDHDAAGFRFGWASFPGDGVTLSTLIETARADLDVPTVEIHRLRELAAESYA